RSSLRLRLIGFGHAWLLVVLRFLVAFVCGERVLRFDWEDLRDEVDLFNILTKSDASIAPNAIRPLVRLIVSSELVVLLVNNLFGGKPDEVSISLYGSEFVTNQRFSVVRQHTSRERISK